MGRPNKGLTINEADGLQLQSMVRSRSMPHSLVRRARIILRSGDERSNREVARRCGVSAPALATGAGAIKSANSPGCTMNCGKGAPALTMTKRWRS